MKITSLEEALQVLQDQKRVANQYLNNYVHKHPADWKGYLYLAASEAILQRNALAIKWLKKAAMLKPNAPVILYNMAYCNRQTGDLVRGNYYYQRVLQASRQNDPETIAVLAASYFELGQTDKGHQLLRKHQTLDHPILHFYRFLAFPEDPGCRRIVQSYAEKPEIVSYLVGFSMKHDAHVYRELDDKLQLTQWIHQFQEKFPGAEIPYPRSHCLPEQSLSFHNEPSPYWIIKETNYSGGQELKLIRNTTDWRSDKSILAQQYVINPLLIEQRKFNIRAYLFIESLHPLSVKVWHDALLFVAPKQFALDDLGDTSVHIANLLTSGKDIGLSKLEKLPGHLLALSTLADTACFSQEQMQLINEGIQRVTQFVKELLQFSELTVPQFMVSTSGAYASKFLGLDIMLDDNFSPWLLEIERFPGIGGVFPETKKINDHFKMDYYRRITGLDSNKPTFV